MSKTKSATLHPDHYLIAKVESLATGAHIHDVSNILAIYRGYFSFVDIPEVADKIAAMERVLRSFIVAGRINDSWKDIGPIGLGTLGLQKKQNISQELSQVDSVKISGTESRQYKGSSTLRPWSKLCK